MIRGIYSSASSLFTLLEKQEAYSHNLANLSTPGFKQEVVRAEEIGQQALARDYGSDGQTAPIGHLPAGVTGDQLEIDYSQGPLDGTGRSLDVAIAGDGFFRIQTPQGERLTRDGTFHKDSNGALVTAAGYAVLGDNGPIRLGDGDLFIDDSGNIFMPNSKTPVARLSLGNVADTATLTPEADNLLAPGTGVVQVLGANQTHVKQGFVEHANVDVSGSVVGMMLALRSYEATQRTLQMQDEALQKLMDVGR
jgi:flagellar basal-body rod protein FlgF